MTRTTLLQLLAHPAVLGEADVRALEQLAEAFPYCQAAHLLLAKAAHDQGSMLASQRLRRAATYAADRARLRQLIEGPASAEANTSHAASADSPAPEAAVASPLPLVASAAPVTLAASTAAAIAELTEAPIAAAEATAPAASPASEAAEVTAPDIRPLAAAEPAEAAGPAAAEPLAAKASGLPELPTATAADVPAASEAATVGEPAPPSLAEVPSVAAPASVEAFVTGEPAASGPIETPTVEAPAALGSLTSDAVASDAAAHAVVAPAAPAAPEPAPPAGATEPNAEPELPAQAPPIRPPLHVARREYGLAALALTEPAPYQLTEPEAAAPPLPPAPRPYFGDDALGYALGEGSRLGFGLEARAAPDASAATALPAAELFEPDAALLAHLAEAAPAPAADSNSLIDSFLRRAPTVARRRSQPPAEAVAQPDLAASSTRAEPDLASESLARILAKQGKNERAIAIYERLMVKNPEKMAYFAAQIDLLRPTA